MENHEKPENKEITLETRVADLEALVRDLTGQVRGLLAMQHPYVLYQLQTPLDLLTFWELLLRLGAKEKCTDDEIEKLLGYSVMLTEVELKKIEITTRIPDCGLLVCEVLRKIYQSTISAPGYAKDLYHQVIAGCIQHAVVHLETSSDLYLRTHDPEVLEFVQERRRKCRASVPDL